MVLMQSLAKRVLRPWKGVDRNAGGMEPHPYQPNVVKLANDLMAVLNGDSR